MQRFAIAFTLAFAVTAPASAAPGPGDAAPDFGGEWLNHDSTSLERLRGRVVLVDFWRTWCEPCIQSIPHLNELYEKHGASGFVVVGVTNEEREKVEQTIAEKGLRYPVAIVAGEDADRAYAIGGYPSAFLIDPRGTIAWAGHPMELPEDKVLELLAQATLIPPLPGEHADINKLLRKRELGKAMKEIESALKKDPESKDLQAAKQGLEDLVAAQLKSAGFAAAGGDYGRARDIYERMQDAFDGHAAAKDAKARLKEMMKSKEAKAEVEAAGEVTKARALWKEGQNDAAAQVLMKMQKKYAGTRSAKLAEELLLKIPH